MSGWLTGIQGVEVGLPLKRLEKPALPACTIDALIRRQPPPSTCQMLENNQSNG
jgi:hypothetical protein